jgi:small-conductance mechanosensitive channel
MPVIRPAPPAVRLLVGLLAAVGGAAWAADPDPAEPDEAAVPTAAVVIDGRVLFPVRGLPSLPATERANAIAGRIRAVAGNPAVAPDDIGIAAGAIGPEIRAGGQRLMLVHPADGRLEGVDVDTLALAHRERIARAVVGYRAARTPAALGRSALATQAMAAGRVLLLLALRYGFRWLDALLERAYSQRRSALEGRLGRDVMQSASLLRGLRGSLRTSEWVIGLLAGFVWLDLALGQFPWTRGLSEGLTGLLLEPLATIGLAIAGYLPNLLFLVVLVLIVRFGLRMLRLYFSAIERGTVILPHFERDWSLPTYKIVRTLVVLVALVMAYPYLPGAGSDAFQGISVFAGLLVSLGAASSVSNVIAGYLVTYGRILQLGDWIKVGEVIGVVSQVRLLTTRVRTVRNEEVTIPNSLVMSSSITNYTRLAREHGLILQAEVGIGYETPWRQVHAMLLEAARRTSGLAPEPPPFVLQRGLGDFAVAYQLNVYRPAPEGMLRTQSELHQHILDVFNEYGVQIMTPSYVADPPAAKVVPKDQWFPAPVPGPPPGQSR